MLVLMSIAAAATMTFTSCSDELNEMSANKTLAPEGADKSLLEADRKSTRLNSSHIATSRMPSSA